MIDFDFTPEQRELARVARAAFANGEDAFAKLGLDGDTPLVDVVLVYEEAGRAAVSAQPRNTAARAAMLNGVSMGLLERSVDHARARHQFGKPIGSFQAVKHKLASMRTLIDGARPIAWYAAYKDGDDFAAAMALVEAERAHAFANREALQVHGGIGFTREHALHRWLEAGLRLMPAYEEAARARARIASALFDGDEE